MCACRDGDTVEIRVNGDALEIRDNHPPDPSVGRPEADAIEVEDAAKEDLGKI